MVYRDKSLKINFIFNAILTLSLAIFPLITFPYVSRVLLPEGIGKVNLALSVIAYFNLFAQLGIPMYGIKASAAVRNDREALSRLVHELLMLSIVLGLITYAALAVTVSLVPRLRDERLLYLIVGMTIPLYSIGMEWMYQGLEEYSYITTRSLVFKAIALIAIFLLVKNEDDYIIYASINVFATGVPYVFNLINARKYIDFRWLGNYDIRRHIKVVLIFFALACTTTIYTNLDNVMLGFMKTDAEVGLYSTAVKIKVLLVSLITSLGAVVLPRASYFAEKGLEDELRTVVNKAVRFVIVASIPLVIFFIMFAAESILIIAGSEFGGSVMPMKIIMPTVLFIGITNVLGIELMVPTGREKAVLWSTVVGATVDLILNAILIPGMGASGAAIGTLCAEAAVMIFQLVYLRSELKQYFSHIGWLKILCAAVVATAVAYFCRLNSLSAIKSFVVSAGIFFVVYFVVLMVLKETFVSECMETIRNWEIFGDKNIEKVFLIAFGIYLAFTISGSTTLVTGNAEVLTVVTVIRLAMLAAAIAIIFIRYIKREYSVKAIVIIAVVTAIILAAAYMSRDYDTIKYWILIVAAYGISLRKLAKTSCIAHIAILAAVFGLAITGALGMSNDIFIAGDRYRYCLGFTYTSFGSNLMLYTVVAWVYWRQEEAKVWEYVVMTAAAIVLFAFTDTKSAFAFSLCIIAASLLLKLIPSLRNYKKIYGYGALAISVVFPIGIIAYSLWGNPNSKIFCWLDNLLSGRLYWGQSAYETYGIRLFGQKITWVGGDGFLEDGTYAYNFVDSSYVKILINFGIILLIAVLIYFVCLTYRAAKRKDVYLLLALSVVIMQSTFDPQLLMVEYNVFAMGLAYVIERDKYIEDSYGMTSGDQLKVQSSSEQ